VVSFHCGLDICVFCWSIQQSIRVKTQRIWRNMTTLLIGIFSSESLLLVHSGSPGCCFFIPSRSVVLRLSLVMAALIFLQLFPDPFPAETPVRIVWCKFWVGKRLFMPLNLVHNWVMLHSPRRRRRNTQLVQQFYDYSIWKPVTVRIIHTVRRCAQHELFFMVHNAEHCNLPFSSRITCCTLSRPAIRADPTV
jgi:hypothetical protein